MKECDILAGVKTYSDPSCIFSGVKTPNPQNLRPRCTRIFFCRTNEQCTVEPCAFTASELSRDVTSIHSFPMCLRLTLAERAALRPQSLKLHPS